MMEDGETGIRKIDMFIFYKDEHWQTKSWCFPRLIYRSKHCIAFIVTQFSYGVSHKPFACGGFDFVLKFHIDIVEG